MVSGMRKPVTGPATVADADRFAADLPWARADEWRDGGTSLLAKIKGEPAGIAVSPTNRVHPTRDRCSCSSPSNSGGRASARRWWNPSKPVVGCPCRSKPTQGRLPNPTPGNTSEARVQ